MGQRDINFGRNLNILRSRNNMSQQELADMIHVTRQTISIWERGEGKPDIYYADDICQVFKISMDELIHGNVMKTEIGTVRKIEEYDTEEGYINRIKKKGFYTINDDELQEFFPIIEIGFARIMVIAMALKKADYDVKEVYENGFSVYISSDEKAEGFSKVIYDIIDCFIHHDNCYIEKNIEKISADVSEVQCRVIDTVMTEILGKPLNEFKYYWIDINENPRGYADTKEECFRQAREQNCDDYEILPLV